MATRIINRSQATMDVVVGTSGGDRLIRLEPGQRNTAAVTPKRVKPASGFDRLMGGNDWIEILTDTAVVYEWVFSGSAFRSYSSLHCVPFMPSGAGPFNPGYRVLEAAMDAREHADPQPAEDAPPPDGRDAEFDMSAREKNPFLYFGEYVRTKIGDTTYITVRLNLKRLGVSENDLKSIKPIWKEEIETVWNSGPVSSTHQRYRFEVEWTDRIPHSSVFVLKDTHIDFPVVGPKGVVSMFTWALNMGKRSDSDLKATYPVAAHEYGHHIGLSDGYYYQGEIPAVADAIVKHSAVYSNKKIEPTYGTMFAYFFGLNPITAPRAEERLNRFNDDGQFQVQNLMTGTRLFGPKQTHTNTTSRGKGYKSGEYRALRSRMDTIDKVLVDAIEMQQLQPLRLDENEFREKQTVPGVYEGHFTTVEGVTGDIDADPEVSGIS